MSHSPESCSCSRCRVAYKPAWEPVYPDLVKRAGTEQRYAESHSMLYKDRCPHCGGAQLLEVPARG